MIVIGQWTIENNVTVLFHFTKIKLKTIFVTHPRRFDHRKTISNNYLCIVFRLMILTIIGQFLEVMLACT